jgi:hypothetical protein
VIVLSRGYFQSRGADRPFTATLTRSAKMARHCDQPFWHR